MRVVHDRRRYRQTPDALTVEDLLSAQELDFELVEDIYLTEPAHEPRKFLPPPRMRSKRSAAPEREPESTLAKVAKLAGLTTAASLLVGAVVASSMLTRQRPEETGETNPVPPQITGAAALGGFVPDGTNLPREGGRASSAERGAVATSQVPVAQTQPVAGDATGATQTTSSTPAEAGAAEKVALVKQFYQRMVSPHPEDALAMLTPELAGDEPGDLVRAWSSMSKVDVDEVEVQPDGTVRAVVTMLQHDGTKLRVTQVLSLATGKSDVISRAVLLSAEQL
jgi:hypothetical protein